jgi:hypothetical protein
VLLALLTVMHLRAGRRTTLAVAIAATLYAVAAFPGFADVTGDVVASRLGLPQGIADIVGHQAVLWGAIFAVLGAAAVVAVRLGPDRGAVVALGITALFGLATFGVRQLDANSTSAEVAAALPAPLDLIDKTTGGEPAGIVVNRDSSPAALFGLQMWNRQADRTFRLGIADAYGAGQLCPLAVAQTGEVSLNEPCAGRDLPRWLVMLDGPRPLRFDNGRVRYDRNAIRLIEFPSGQGSRPSRSVAPRVHVDSTTTPQELTAPVTPPRASGEALRRCNVQ